LRRDEEVEEKERSWRRGLGNESVEFEFKVVVVDVISGGYDRGEERISFDEGTA
jgi:hypothetical protein